MTAPRSLLITCPGCGAAPDAYCYYVPLPGGTNRPTVCGARVRASANLVQAEEEPAQRTLFGGAQWPE